MPMGPDLVIRIKAPAIAHKRPPPPPAPGTPAKRRCLGPPPSSAAGTPRVEKASTKAPAIAHKRPPPPAPVTPAKRRCLGPPPSSAAETPQKARLEEARPSSSAAKPSAPAARRAPTTPNKTEEETLGHLLAKIALWQKKLPRHPGAEESWLDCRVSRGEAYLGCEVCAKHPPALAAYNSDLASFRLSASRARLRNLQRHAAGFPHRAAEEASLGSSPSVIVPPLADFQALWDRLGGAAEHLQGRAP